MINSQPTIFNRLSSRIRPTINTSETTKYIVLAPRTRLAPMETSLTQNITGAIIAGGENSRMSGRDKCLMQLGDRSILELLLKKLAPQVDQVILNANGDLTRFEQFEYPIISDQTAEYEGPLAGVLAALKWAIENAAETEWLITTPSDTPLIPENIVNRLLETAISKQSDICFAKSGNRFHYLNAIWNTKVFDQVNQSFNAGQRSLKRVFASLNVSSCAFTVGDYDPFLNINTPEDLSLASSCYSAHISQEQL